MNENVNMKPEGTGLQMASTLDSAGIMGDSTVSQNSVHTIVPTEDMQGKTDSSIYGQWIIVGMFVVVFAIIYFLYKQVKSVNWRLQEIGKKVVEQNNIITKQNKAIDTLRNRIDKLELNTETKPTSKVQSTAPKMRNYSEQKLIVSTGVKSISSELAPQSTSIIRYATLQAPDSNGTLRFAERSMTEEITDQKMFEVELNTATGKGTYRINQSAKSLLLSDLQQLRDFVEPFTINSNTPAQRIIDVKPGIIHQDGKFWIVDELAIIKIV